MKVTKAMVDAGWFVAPRVSKQTVRTILEAALVLSDQEEWRPIPGYERYEASDLGNVRRARDDRGRFIGRILDPHRGRTGHLKVSVYGERGQWRTGVHRLVCLAFHGPAPMADSVVCHNDGNPENNRPENLRWGTVKDNHDDMMRHRKERVLDVESGDLVYRRFLNIKRNQQVTP